LFWTDPNEKIQSEEQHKYAHHLRFGEREGPKMEKPSRIISKNLDQGACYGVENEADGEEFPVESYPLSI
jgi:hypothetical protein